MSTLSEAIWYVIQGDASVVWGVLIALYTIVSIFMVMFGGQRFDRKGVRKGVIEKVDDD